MSFRVTMSLIGGVGVLLLMLPTLIVLVTSFTSGYSLKFPPRDSHCAGIRRSCSIRRKLSMR
jgi:ABC-type spermidine/putrescine transport system permease subunit II